MARSDLLVSLVRAGAVGDRKAVRNVTEAIIAEERAKQHTVLADRLAREISSNGGAGHTQLETYYRGHDFLTELVPRRQLDELVLPVMVRTAIGEFIEEQLRADLLRAHGLEPRHRFLLTGPPGTGKTTLAEAVAESLGVPLYIVRYDAIIGSYLGETASRLRRVFDYARTQACVLFFDEFDAIGKERGDLNETGEIKRVVTALLMQVDGVPTYTIIAAATNHPELLDRATWRRFQLQLSLPLPDKPTLAAYLEQATKQFDEPLGHAPSVISAKLGLISFAEAEEFVADLCRRHVLSMGQASLKSIVAERLELWSARECSLVGREGENDVRTPSLAPDPVPQRATTKPRKGRNKDTSPIKGTAG